MAKYVDSVVVPVVESRLTEYKKMARQMGKLFMEYGALRYTECVADDVPVGKVTSFPRGIKLKAGEVVVFGWIEYESKKSRDSAKKNMMSDPRMGKLFSGKDMPFDGKRLIFGSFKTMVEL